MNYELGEAIAMRKLYLTQDDGTRKTVVIKLGAPRQYPDSSDYYIPFQIVGTGSELVMCAGGIDGFQALQDVMIIIGAQLSSLNQSCGGRLAWEAGEEGDLGFPEPSANEGSDSALKTKPK
jgi:Domain of unknown function (DUF6968)